jgi:acyl-CoA thioesterase
MLTRMAFDDDIALTPDGDGTIADGWATPRGPHGGYVMALLASAMQRVVADAARQPRSLTAHFLRPPAVGPVRVTTEIARAGRSMTTVSARMEQAGRPVALALGAFSGAYEAPELGEVPMPAVAPPEAEAAPLDGAPPFARRLALQPRLGEPPWSGSDRGEVGGWLDLPERDVLDGPALCVLADGYYPAIWPRMTEFHAAPTIDLTVHVRAQLPVKGPLLARFTSRLAKDGFFEEDGELWTRDGTLVAQSRQLALLLPPA